MGSKGFRLDCRYCGIPCRNPSQLDKHISLNHWDKLVQDEPDRVRGANILTRGSLIPADINRLYDHIMKLPFPTYAYGGPMSNATLIARLTDIMDRITERMTSPGVSPSELEYLANALNRVAETRSLIQMEDDK